MLPFHACLFLVSLHCEPLVDFTTLHPFDFDRNLFNFLYKLALFSTMIHVSEESRLLARMIDEQSFLTVGNKITCLLLVSLSLFLSTSLSTPFTLPSFFLSSSLLSQSLISSLPSFVPTSLDLSSLPRPSTLPSTLRDYAQK